MTESFSVITLDEAKAHLGISHDRLDGYVQSLIATASAAALAYIGGLDDEEVVPEQLKAAVRLHVASLFENRENAAFPPAALQLLQDLRGFYFGGCA